MSSGPHDIEDRLTALLRRQADAVAVTDATWTEARMGPVAAGRRRRAPYPVLAGLAAAVCLVLAVTVWTGDPEDKVVVTGPAAQGADEPPATTATTAAPAPASGGSLRAETRQVSLTADAVSIDAGGRQFVTVQPVVVHSDPGDSTYTTLELKWREHGVEMRLFIYFTANGREWWSNEIRTYDGNDPGEWITYTGDFFRRPLGTPFTGDFTVATPDPAVGRLHLADARLEAFRPAPGCATASGPFVIDPGTSPITIEGSSSGYGVMVRLLDSATCTAVVDQDRYVYDWDTADASIVRFGGLPVADLGLPRHANLTPVAKGRATVHVTARDPATGATVAETDIEVVVGDVKQVPVPTTFGSPSP
ncbi:MAG: hypothetical protein ACR2MO_16585 [Acidimicrobiales bacterium]